MLDDYTDNDKLELYDDTMELPFIKDFRLYTLLKLYDFKGKIVLDCPCSTGEYTKIFLEKGAKYVLGSDIVPEQIDFAKKKLEKIYPKYNKRPYTLLVHDSKIPKQLISEFEVDIAIILHLFCFAKNYQELLNMVRFVYKNLKKGGKIVSFHCCPINSGQEKEFEKLNGKTITYKEFKNQDEPGFLHTLINDTFDLIRYIYPNSIVEKALLDVGFKEVKYQAYQVNPDTEFPDLLCRHQKTCDYYFLEATK